MILWAHDIEALFIRSKPEARDGFYRRSQILVEVVLVPSPNSLTCTKSYSSIRMFCSWKLCR